MVNFHAKAEHKIVGVKGFPKLEHAYGLIKSIKIKKIKKNLQIFLKKIGADE